jgi:hypothetical protein
MRLHDLPHLAKGALSFLPGAALLRRHRRRGGETASPEYCYAVWLRHLSCLHEAGLAQVPRVVAELGPGDSIGVGLCALLCGAEIYLGLDQFPFVHSRDLTPLFDRLVALLSARTPIPDEAQIPPLRPLLPCYAFPAALLDDAWLARCLAPERVAGLRRALQGPLSGAGPLRYVAPWTQALIKPGSVDLVLSQAVLEHVDDLPHTLSRMAGWLAPGGYASHLVDFRCHDLAHLWNGHLAYSDLTWRIVRGRRDYAINRVPLSRLRRLAAGVGLAELRCQRERAENTLPRAGLPRPFRELPEEDLTTATAHFIWRRIPVARGEAVRYQ